MLPPPGNLSQKCDQVVGILKVRPVPRNRLASQLLSDILRLLSVYATPLHMGESEEDAPIL
jgi:hypothetical protein